MPDLVLVSAKELEKASILINRLLKESKSLEKETPLIKEEDEKDLTSRKRRILGLIRDNKGIIAEQIVKKLIHEPGSSRSPVFNDIKFLKEIGMIIPIPDETNSQKKLLYINDKSIIVSSITILDSIDLHIKNIIDKIIPIFNNYYDPVRDIKNSIELISLLLCPIRLFQDISELLNIISILYWPNQIEDKKTLRTLYSNIFTKIRDIHLVIIEKYITIIKSKGIQENIGTVIKSSFFNKISYSEESDSDESKTEKKIHKNETLLKKIKKYYRTFEKFGLASEVEPLIDIIWKLTSEDIKSMDDTIIYDLYPELIPLTYGNTNEKMMSWKKAIEYVE